MPSFDSKLGPKSVAGSAVTCIANLRYVKRRINTIDVTVFKAIEREAESLVRFKVMFDRSHFEMHRNGADLHRRLRESLVRKADQGEEHCCRR